ncbi:hypothetical protein OM416_19815 [Paenibacillus sp. LS1]|uniref:hypothetical protein n=1 Tax=Paenibacillus sp. LS1 TaxID=2992120 RepID=UPI00222F0685|nr:hypothetical protein [Paenibacillus sp. LS1]MCW3793843.1 hypothetical protein [Paenibacillus sp. LS1]
MFIILDLPFTITTIFVVVAITLKLFRKMYLEAFFFGLFTGSFLVYSISKYYGVVNATISFWPFIFLSILYCIYLIFEFVKEANKKKSNIPFASRDLHSFIVGSTGTGRATRVKLIFHAFDLAREGHQVHYVNLTKEGEKLSTINNNQNLIVYNNKKPQLVIEDLTRELKNRMSLFNEDDHLLETLPEIYIIYDEGNNDQYIFESLCSLLNEYKNDLRNLKINFVFSSENALAFSGSLNCY